MLFSAATYSGLCKLSSSSCSNNIVIPRLDEANALEAPKVPPPAAAVAAGLVATH